FVATAFGRITSTRFYRFAVRPQTGLCVHTPEIAAVRRIYCRIRLRPDEHPLPTERFAKVRTILVESIKFRHFQISITFKKKKIFPRSRTKKHKEEKTVIFTILGASSWMGLFPKIYSLSRPPAESLV